MHKTTTNTVNSLSPSGIRLCTCRNSLSHKGGYKNTQTVRAVSPTKAPRNITAIKEVRMKSRTQGSARQPRKLLPYHSYRQASGTEHLSKTRKPKSVNRNNVVDSSSPIWQITTVSYFSYQILESSCYEQHSRLPGGDPFVVLRSFVLSNRNIPRSQSFRLGFQGCQPGKRRTMTGGGDIR